VELCSADLKKCGKKLRDVTESEQTQSTNSSDDASFLRDTMRLLENFSYRTSHAKEVRVFGKPELISTSLKNSIFETQGKGTLSSCHLELSKIRASAREWNQHF
jgi:hypothetical protein